MPDTAASRIMKSVLIWAIRLYPPETRSWGEAIVAEANSVTEFSSALSWTAGGLVVAFRAFFSRLIRRPAANKGPAIIVQIPPPLPWKLALVCFAISGALLFVPEVRQGLSVTFSAWRSEFRPPDETAKWEKIGREAESRGDAAAMAFAAMRLPGREGAHFEEAVGLAERAVAKDPSLTWTYYFLTYRIGDSGVHGSPHPELTQHLQSWDPKNAVPYLAEADAIARAHRDDPQWRGRSGFSPEQIVRIRGRDPRWLDLMDRAFAAPVYDTYFARRLDLDLQVMQRLGALDPQRAMSAHLYYVLPSLLNLREYSALRLAQGEEAERAGQWENAASQYWAVAQFGQRVCLGGKTDVEPMIARVLQETSFKHLQPVLLKLGRAQEAQTVAYEAQLQDPGGPEWRARFQSQSQRLETFSLASGLFIHIFAIALDASAFLMVIVLFTLAVRRAPRFVRFSLTYAPLVLVLSCVCLLCAYHPYAAFYKSYLANHSAHDFESVANFLMVSGAPGYDNNTATPAKIAIYFWWAILSTGGGIGIWLVSKAVWKTARRPSNSPAF